MTLISSEHGICQGLVLTVYQGLIIINGIFTQDNPSVLSTVINGALLTNKLEIIKIYKLKTIKNYNKNYNKNYK